MQSLKHKSLFIALLVTFLLGLLIGRLVKDWPVMQLDTSVDLADVFGFITGLIALLIAWYVASTLDREKKKEEYVIAFVLMKLKGIQEAIDATVSIVEANHCQLSSVNSKLKTLSRLFLDLKKVCNMCNLTFNESQVKDIKNRLKQMKRLCTEADLYYLGSDNVAFPNNFQLTIENSIIEYSEMRVDKIKADFSELHNMLFKSCMRL